MRLSRMFAVFAGLGLIVPALQVGCFPSGETCDGEANCLPEAAGSTGMGGSGGTDIPTDPSCIPSQAEEVVGDTCGIFVAASGNDANDGSKSSPVATLAHALELAKAARRPIYACAEAFTGPLEVPAGFELFGGLDCNAGWTWSDAGRTSLTAMPDQVPLKLLAGEGTTKVENFTVTAADAMQAGGSSIAAIVDGVTAQISWCDLTTGSGRDGANGEAPVDAPTVGAAGIKGSNACELPGLVKGGDGGMVACGNGTTQGGTGGKGGVTDMMSGEGQTGAEGQPSNGTDGLGGVGAVGMANCALGDVGKDGDLGTAGMGGTALGTISSGGFNGTPGQDGGVGTPGQGGGGGGGARSGVFCGSPAVDGPGASGGGGGAGGCGGKGGGGGKAGGSSIALVSVNATLTLNQITMTTGAGGKGGAGAIGQGGAIGGVGGIGGDPSGIGSSKKGCTGGEGGSGGQGGPGGGGRGGHSLGIVFRGASPTSEGLTVTPGVPGVGGLGASGDQAGDGAAGLAAMDPVEAP